MSAPTRRAAGRGPVDAGMTLVEVLVAISLSTLLVIALGSFAVVTLRTMDSAEARMDNINTGQTGMAAVTKVLRTAVRPDQLNDNGCTACEDTAIVTASGTQVRFYANMNNTGGGPSLVSLETIADPNHAGTSLLRQTIVPPTIASNGSYSFCSVGANGCSYVRRIVARGLPRLTTNPTIFGYYGFDGVALRTGTLPADDLIKVASIDVTLTVQLRPGQTRTPAQTLVQRVSLPNADASVLNEQED
ncbi:PulJ/GspJ family protein [Nocardioides sambongensis]|uniref:PulJ/GspJ family protein n=1 Tax=Nocardioides sambongensis TaxID=2589074 RepID=UPI0011291DA1|nr:prepilin-type N-terminal cleavage/methylation domain-containing protein [Nocardioides sambongensis]